MPGVVDQMFGPQLRPMSAASGEPSPAETNAEPSTSTELPQEGRIGDPTLWFVLLVGLALLFGWVGATVEVSLGRT